MEIFNVETADKLIIWARETGLLQKSVQQKAEQTNEELFQQRKPELLSFLSKYLTDYKIAIHFKSSQGESSFNNYNNCAKEIKRKLIELGTDGNRQLIEENQITINPGWTGQVSSNQIRHERTREEEVADSLNRVLFEIYPEMQFRKQTIVGETPNYISIFLKAVSTQSSSSNSECSFIFST